MRYGQLMDMPDLPFLMLALAAILFIRILEVADGSRPVAADLLGEAMRIGMHLAIYSLSLLLVWRPVLALVLTTGGMIVLFVANRIKKRVVFEPIVFSDLALLGQIVRHPHLYFLSPWTLWGAFVAMAGSIIGLAMLETPQAATLWLPTIMLAVVASCWLQRNRLRQHFEPVVLAEQTSWGSRALGLPTALALQLLGWLSSRPPVDDSQLASVPADANIVVMQLESFADLPQRLERRSTPFWEALKARAAQHGPLKVAIKGANTMRTEHAVITGIGNAALGYDRFDPYLRPALGRALPLQMKKLGFHTSFIHPNDLRFFRRDRVLSRLGFDALIGEADFDAPERVGRYVSDLAVVRRMIIELEKHHEPQMLFAVTMENHGPWIEGRLTGVEPGLPSYRHHLENMERALAELLRYLEERDRRSILVLYGDHLPALPETAAWTVHDTDYLIFDTAGKNTNIEPKPLRPEQLLDTAFALSRL